MTENIHLHLVKQKVDYMIRETFESAIKFGGVILQELGVDEDEVQRITDEIRERDDERFETEIAADDVYAGVGCNIPMPSTTNCTINST
jgi:glutathione-regulated potassium-efflux system protein KefB